MCSKRADARWVLPVQGRDDFLAAIDVMRDKDIQRRLSQIVHFDGEVNDIKDIKRVFATDLQAVQTVFKWGL